MIEKNETLVFEFTELKKEAQEKQTIFQDLVKLNSFNDDLILQLEKVKREV